MRRSDREIFRFRVVVLGGPHKEVTYVPFAMFSVLDSASLSLPTVLEKKTANNG